MFRTSWFFLIPFMFFFSQAVHAQCTTAGTCTRINNGANATINEHSVCRVVTNSSGGHIMVPHNTATEWTNFRNNLPSGVSAAVCGCSGGYSHGGFCFRKNGTTGGESCDTVCTSYGGCNAAGTVNHIGTGGTLANCLAVLTGLAMGGTTIQADNTGTYASGCQALISIYDYRYRFTGSATTCAAAAVSTIYQRACACNN